MSITISATRTLRSLRQAFLQHTLCQEIWHFDKKCNAAVATQLTTNSNLIHQGIAEKLTFGIQLLALFFTSFVVALSVRWKLALITICIIHAMLLVCMVCIAIAHKQELGSCRSTLERVPRLRKHALVSKLFTRSGLTRRCRQNTMITFKLQQSISSSIASQTWRFGKAFGCIKVEKSRTLVKSE